MYKKYKEQLIKYIKSGISHCEDEEKIEEFYCFIDEIEKLAESDNRLYEIAADCYTQMGNPKKAKESFLKYYDPKNKKQVKKLLDYDRVRSRIITRPSRRADRLPPDLNM